MKPLLQCLMMTWEAIIITGRGGNDIFCSYRGSNDGSPDCYLPFMSSWIPPVASLHWHCSAHHEAPLWFIPRGRRAKREQELSCLLGPCVDFFNDTVAHVEPCINADSWRLVGSLGLTIHSHMEEEETHATTREGKKRRAVSQLYCA